MVNGKLWQHDWPLIGAALQPAPHDRQHRGLCEGYDREAGLSMASRTGSVSTHVCISGL